jgi:prevent-host-death family protein
VVVTVGVREFRENLRAYLERVKAGEVVVVTERGTPVARVTAPVPSYIGVGEGPADLSLRAEEYLRELVDAD